MGKDGLTGNSVWNRIDVFEYQWDQDPALERIQGQLIISALRIPWNSPTAIAYATAGLKPIWYHIYKMTIQFYRKIFFERDSKIFHDLKVELENLGNKKRV